MDIYIVIWILHLVGVVAWAASLPVLAAILLANRRNDDAALRALAEAAHLGRRILRPAIAITTLTALALAAALDRLGEAWLVLSTAFGALALILGRAVVAPAAERAARLPRGTAVAAGRRALRTARLDLGVQAVAVALLVLAPGWGGAAILAGLLACLALTVALFHEEEPKGPRHA